MLLLQGRRYAWAAEDKPLTTLTRGGCKSCGLFEDRRIPFVDVRPCPALAQAPGCAASSAPSSAKQSARNMACWLLLAAGPHQGSRARARAGQYLRRALAAVRGRLRGIALARPARRGQRPVRGNPALPRVRAAAAAAAARGRAGARARAGAVWARPRTCSDLCGAHWGHTYTACCLQAFSALLGAMHAVYVQVMQCHPCLGTQARCRCAP